MILKIFIMVGSIKFKISSINLAHLVLIIWSRTGLCKLVIHAYANEFYVMPFNFVAFSWWYQGVGSGLLVGVSELIGSFLLSSVLRAIGRFSPYHRWLVVLTNPRVDS